MRDTRQGLDTRTTVWTVLPHAGTPQKAAARKHPQFVSGLSNRQSIWFKVGEFFFFVIRTCPVILTHRGHDISVFRSSCQARIGRDRNLATEPSQRVSSSSSRISRIVSTLTTKPTHVLSPPYLNHWDINTLCLYRVQCEFH